ncbi:hypothetical protein R5R35_000746 [Gryllus longicercus]|uniref:Uncharacterized protein n=1 Tax=Gryllus longicercus TaxID=2509291 RepID=A0AAN9VYF7_9ORTH
MDHSMSLSAPPAPPTASDCRTLHDFFQYWRTLVVQEQRYREQLQELQALAAARESESSELRDRASTLQADVEDKASTMLRLQSELELANKQSELLRQKLRQMEEDIAGFKRYNAQLAAELAAKAEDETSESEAEEVLQRRRKEEQMEEQLQRLRERAAERDARAQQLAGDAARLEAELAAARAERDSLDAQRRQMLQERQEEMQIVQKALEEAQAESAAAKRRFDQDFERLRTVNTAREQQLLEDFEWKLREVQQTCKRRLQESERAAEQRVAAARQELEQRLSAAERRVADLYDTQRALRTATRDIERAHEGELKLKEEITRLKALVETERNFAATIQRNYDRQVTDAERKLEARVQEMRDELTQQWEDKVRGECARLRGELQQLHAEEIALAVRAAREERDAGHQAALAQLERRLQNALNEVTALRTRMAEKEAQHERDLADAQTNADSAAFELRRKLDKLDMQYQEQIEKLQEQHEQHIEKLTEDNDRRVAQMEQTWQMQVTSTRTTLELVKEQLERDAQDRLEALERQHQRKLEEQWQQLTAERERALEEAHDKHHQQLEQLRKDLEEASKDNPVKDLETAGLRSAETVRTPQTAIIQSGEGSSIPSLPAGVPRENCEQVSEESGELGTPQCSPSLQLPAEQSEQNVDTQREAEQLEPQGERGTVPAAAAGETDNGASAGGCIIIQPGGDDETTADAAAINTAAIQLMQTDEQCGGEGSSARKRGNGADKQSGNSTGPPTRMGSGVPSGASQPKGQGKQSNTSKGRHGRHKSTTASAQQNGRGGLQGVSRSSRNSRKSRNARNVRTSGPGPGPNNPRPTQ